MTGAPVGQQARELLDRVRAALPGGAVREVRMFGAISVMLDDTMVVAVHEDGSMLVRVDPVEDEHLLHKPGAARAEMGTGRSMGQGWIHLDAAALHDDTMLAGWVDAATRRHARHRPATGE